MPLVTPEELAKYPPPPLPQWVVSRGLLKSPEQQIRLHRLAADKTLGEPYFYSNPGPQTWVLVCPFDEILIGGARGGSKTMALIAWMGMGDPSLSKDDPAHYSYLLEPSFRGLILRKEYQSLIEMIDEMKDVYGPLGGKPKGDPVVFEFESGAKIYTNHLGDKDAFEKYRGQGLTKIGIEELTQIPEKQSYIKLFGSLRSKKQVREHNGKIFPALRTQIMSTANPDGPGKSWTKKRFVKVYTPDGEPIPPNNPMRDPQTDLRRIFIPMSRRDNPYLRDNKQYTGMLLEQDETIRRAWMDGDWDADAGQFFSEWRPNGPITAEEKEKFPWARHVVDGAPLQPWSYRWGGGDFGYDHPAAFHKMCRSDDGRVHVYDELMLRHVGSYEMGVRVAEWWLPDLEMLPDKSIIINFSSDAFSKTDDSHTKAEQIAAGIQSVLGPYGAFLLKFTDEERVRAAADPTYAERMFAQHRSKAEGRFVIALKPASKDVESRWAFMRDLLRFRPALRETEEEIKARLKATYTRAAANGDAGAALIAYEREISKVKRPEAVEVLPKLQVWSRCKNLIRCMEEANKDEDRPNRIVKWNAVDGVGGDDALESCFVAGTLIATETGERPIERIRVGDLVHTREGLRRVSRCGLTSEMRDVRRLELSTGQSLVGTPEHPIFIEGRGFVALETLSYGDRVLPWRPARESGSAPVHVVRCGVIGEAPVYNLAVEEVPEYFANGILVHNCGQGLHHFKDIERKMPKSYYMQERMENIQTEYEASAGERITDPTRIAMIQRAQAARWDKENRQMTGGIRITRQAVARHRQPHHARSR